MEYNSHKVFVNTTWRVISYGWPILFSIIITPIVLKSLGIHDYGVYMFFNTIISLLGLLDLGIFTAVSKYLAEYHARNDTEKIKILLGTALTIFSGVAILGFLIFILGSFITSYSDIFSEYSKYQTGIIFAGLTFVMMILSSIYTSTFEALQRFDLSSKIGIVLLTTQQVFILISVLLGYSINGIFIIQFVISFISFFIQRYMAHKILPEIPKKLSWDHDEVRHCYKFGLTTFINNIATTSLTYFDRLIIPFFLGPSSLTYYSLPGNITMRIPGFSNSLASVIFPMTSGLHGLGDLEKIRNLYTRSFRLITVMASAIAVTTIVYGHQILQYWISFDFAEKATSVLIILTLTNFILALSGPLSSFLLGLGKLKFLTTLSISMAILNTLLLVILLPLAGINGAAWAYLLSLLPVAYMFYYTEKNYLKLSLRKKYYREIVLGNIFVTFIIFITAKLLLIHVITSLVTVLIVGGFTILIYIILYWLFGFFEQEDINSIKLFFNQFAKRKLDNTRNII